SITASNGRTLPAYVAAAAAVDPSLRTLVLTPQPDGGVSARLVGGVGNTLDTQSTLLSTRSELTGNDDKVAVLAANLVSQGGLDPTELLSEYRVRFVLLTEPAQLLGEDVASAAAGM